MLSVVCSESFLLYYACTLALTVSAFGPAYLQEDDFWEALFLMNSTAYGFCLYLHFVMATSYVLLTFKNELLYGQLEPVQEIVPLCPLLLANSNSS